MIAKVALVSLILVGSMASASDKHEPKAMSQFQLANGLNVIVDEDHSRPVAAIALAIHSGSANEGPGERGTAHMFEHLMFLGSRHLGPGGVDALSARVGGSGATGTTFPDVTVYHQAFPSRATELMIWAEAEKLGFFLDALTTSQVDAERRVVLEEMASTIESEAFGREDEALASTLFAPGHPYRFTVMGRRDDVEKASLARLSNFYRRNYLPSNAVLVVAGDVDPVSVRRWVERYFGPFASTPSAARPALPEAGRTSGRTFIEDPHVQGSAITLAWPVDGLNAPQASTLFVASRLIAQVADDVTRELRRLDPRASLSADYDGRERAGVFVLRAKFSKPVQLDGIEQALKRFLQGLATQRSKGEALTRAKTQIKREILGATDGVENHAATLARLTAITANPKYVPDLISKIEATDAESIRQLFGSLEARDKAVLSVVPLHQSVLAASHSVAYVAGPDPGSPAGLALSAPPPTTDRNPHPPKLAKTRPAVRAQKWSGRIDGVSALGETDARLALQYGTVVARPTQDLPPNERAAAIRLMAELVRARSDSSSQSPEDLQDASFAWTQGPASLRVSFTALAQDWKAVARSGVRLLRTPHWTEREFESAKKRALETLADDSANPSIIADMAIGDSLLDERAGASARGIADALRHLSFARFRAQSGAAWRLRIYTVGPLTGAPQRPMRGSHDARHAGPPQCPVSALRHRISRTPVKVVLPESPRTAIGFGSIASSPKTQARAAEEVLSYMLTGNFDASMVRELRERRGLTTNVRSYFADDLECPLFVIRTTVDPRKTDEAIAAARSVIDDLRAQLSAGAGAKAWADMRMHDDVRNADPLSRLSALELDRGAGLQPPTSRQLGEAFDRLFKSGHDVVVVAGPEPNGAATSEPGQAMGRDDRSNH